MKQGIRRFNYRCADRVAISRVEDYLLAAGHCGLGCKLCKQRGVFLGGKVGDKLACLVKALRHHLLLERQNALARLHLRDTAHTVRTVLTFLDAGTDTLAVDRLGLLLVFRLDSCALLGRLSQYRVGLSLGVSLNMRDYFFSAFHYVISVLLFCSVFR